MPFDTDPDWPQPLARRADRLPRRVAGEDGRGQRLHRRQRRDGRTGGQARSPVKGVVRVSRPVHDGRRHRRGGGPDATRRSAAHRRNWRPCARRGDGRGAANAEAHLDKIIRLLKASGVDFPGNKNMKFSRLDPMTGASLLHAEGEWMNGDGRRSAAWRCRIGPEVGNVTADAGGGRDPRRATAKATTTWCSPASASTRRRRTPSRAAAIRSCGCTWRSSARTWRWATCSRPSPAASSSPCSARRA